MTARLALYARYSSDQQNPRSIADQLAVAERHAAARGWTVVARFEDAAISGAAMANRPGLLALLAAAEAGAFDRVLVEHEDRLSRSLEHLAHIANRLSYARVILSTLATDQVETMHVAFNGAMAQQYLVNLSQKTRRGMTANAEQGKATGSRLFGYVSTPGGGMAVVEAEANAVRRIFDLYGQGYTGREIADRLNRDGVPAPRGGLWRAGQITGSRHRGNGILHTELYIGQKVWNRLDVRKNPVTGRRLPTVRPAAEWKRTPVPHLRILSDEAWAAARARLERLAINAGRGQARRRGGLFSGLLRCGCCGAGYTVYNAGRLICAAHREKGPVACGNGRTVSRQAIETRVLEGLRRRLLAPEAVRAYVRAYHEAWTQAEAERRADVAPLEARLAQLDRAIDRLVDAVCDGRDSPAIRERLARAEADKAAAGEALARARGAAGEAAQPVRLHPRLPDLYARRVERLQAHLAAASTGQDDADQGDGDPDSYIATVESVRDLIDHIAITPTSAERAAPVEVTLHGRLALLLDRAPATPTAARRPPEYGGLMVAGASYRPPPTSRPLTIRVAC